MGTTIVSAFISGANNRTDRDTEKYLEYALPLLQLDIPKVIFIESVHVEAVKKLANTQTQIIPFKKNELDLFNQVSSMDLELPQIRNFDKDTKEYMHLMTNKTFFCKMAIQLNPYSHNKFIWLDFGISHILKNKKLGDLIKSNYYFPEKKIRIGGIWPDDIAKKHDIFNQINWFFAGGVFGGTSDSLLIFYDKCKSQFIKNLNQNKIIWEVNLWRQIYESDPNLFQIYRSNHDESLISNLSL